MGKTPFLSSTTRVIGKLQQGIHDRPMFQIKLRMSQLKNGSFYGSEKFQVEMERWARNRGLWLRWRRTSWASSASLTMRNRALVLGHLDTAKYRMILPRHRPVIGCDFDEKCNKQSFLSIDQTFSVQTLNEDTDIPGLEQAVEAAKVCQNAMYGIVEKMRERV